MNQGLDSSYDKGEVIYAFYDADTGNTGYTLYTSTGQKTSGQSLYIADRSTTAESGYVYDPSVPDSDPYFGNADVCYSFSTNSSTANFLAVYITGLPYWMSPSNYPHSGAEVAAAILLAYGDMNGYPNMISTDWQTQWPNNTKDSPTSYVDLISTLCTDMSWTSTGTPDSAVGPGALSYLASVGYSNFIYNTYDVTTSRASSWTNFENALNHGRPVIVHLASSSFDSGYHYALARGYWNDGHICLINNKGTSQTNLREDWNQTTPGTTDITAEVVKFWDFRDMTIIASE